MRDRVDSLRLQFQNELKDLQRSKDVEELKVRYLGKKGILAELMFFLRDCPPQDRPVWGQLINAVKEEITTTLDRALEAFILSEEKKRLEEEWIDITLPGRRKFCGRYHPISAMLEKALNTLSSMGFSVQYGPDIEDDWYNFEGLNFPKDHPARDMQDTFYIADNLLLRTHTSNTQLRVMEKQAPPIRIVAPGTVYRNEDISARSHVFFHQIEGIYIDKKVSLVDLLSTMKEFWCRLFQKSLDMRFRPSYFPFVEPGVEVDLRCTSCEGGGCRLCKYSGWLEVAGAGMVHPEVLKNGGIDPEIYSGYAWGMGIERLAMIRYGIKDIRQFAQNDMGLLEQF